MITSRVALAVAVLLPALLLDVVVLSRLPLPLASPDVLLLGLVALALHWGPGAGSVTGFGAGLLRDLAPPADHLVGRWAFSLCLTGYLVGVARDDARRSALVPVLAAVPAAVGSLLLFLLAGLAAGDARVAARPLLPLIEGSALYAAVLAPFVVPVVLALARRVEPDPAPLSREGRP